MKAHRALEFCSEVECQSVNFATKTTFVKQIKWCSQQIRLENGRMFYEGWVQGLDGQPKLQLINQFRIDDICIFCIAMKNVMGIHSLYQGDCDAEKGLSRPLAVSQAFAGTNMKEIINLFQQTTEDWCYTLKDLLFFSLSSVQLSLLNDLMLYNSLQGHE